MFLSFNGSIANTFLFSLSNANGGNDRKEQ